NPKFESFPVLKKISYLDFYYYISSHHTFHSDQPSMQFETEMRFPYLDHQFVQKYFNCTNLDKGLTKKNNKSYLRKNVNKILSSDVLYMPKKGFSMPTKNWLKDVNLERDFSDLETYFGSEYKNWMNNPAKKWLMISTTYFLRNED
ncbi:asparagine synthase-related protein, partial [Algoriella sp.]|uniref:asparagine synthase-related protein n=1 Tax=Algoriella sp. TaxID=1872434 RepID=UPI001B017C37